MAIYKLQGHNCRWHAVYASTQFICLMVLQGKRFPTVSYPVNKMGATMRRHGHGLIHIPYAHEIKCDGMSTAFMRLTAHFEFFSVDRLNMIFHMSKIKNTMSTMLPITIAAPVTNTLVIAECTLYFVVLFSRC